MEEAPAPYSHHESLTLENFTAFSKAHFEFCPGVNVFVGENGTGKTHVLKILYAVGEGITSPSMMTSLPFSLPEVFGFGFEDGLTRRLDHQVPKARLSGRFCGSDWELEDEDTTATEDGGARFPRTYHDAIPRGTTQNSVFVPSNDVIGDLALILSIRDTYSVRQSKVVIDLASKLNALKPKTQQPYSISIYRRLIDLIEGTPTLKDRSFSLKTEFGLLSFALIAEGHKKLACLARLIEVGALNPGTCLYWDEPEAHLNPSYMDELCGIFLELSRNGVQVFLATHSYIILKELEVQAQPSDSLKFFALEKSDEGTKIHEARKYLDIKPNLIEKQYESLFNRSLERRSDS